MRVCFHFEPSSRDVSSGMEHSLHQWHELLYSFGVDVAYVINTTDSVIKSVNDSIDFIEVEGISDVPGPVVAISIGNHANHRNNKFPDNAVVYIGGSAGTQYVDAEHFTIPSRAVLYPREAAAIVLEEQWQLRL